MLDKYSDQLVAEGVCTKEEVEGVVANYEQVFIFNAFLKSEGCEVGLRLTETWDMFVSAIDHRFLPGVNPIKLFWHKLHQN